MMHDCTAAMFAVAYKLGEKFSASREGQLREKNCSCTNKMSEQEARKRQLLGPGLGPRFSSLIFFSTTPPLLLYFFRPT